MSTIRDLSNIFIFDNDLSKSIVFPGPAPIAQEQIPEVASLLEHSKHFSAEKFSFEMNEMRWRGQRNNEAVDGQWTILRRLPMDAPTLDKLPTPLPKDVYEALMSPAIGRGGLIHIVGGPGCGKTTTGSATVVSRLMKFGGMCTTIEDPDEMRLNGWHGIGYCTQNSISNWADSMKRALRCQPSGSKLMMYVGEVRDAEAARIMLRAANNGFLVISTGFGSNIISGIHAFQQLLPADERHQLADALRLIVYQYLDNEVGALSIKMLKSESPESPVAIAIRNGKLSSLTDEIRYQETANSLKLQ